MADCTYRFTDQDGNERVIEGKAAFKAYLLDGGLQHLLPSFAGRMPGAAAPVVALSKKQGEDINAKLEQKIFSDFDAAVREYSAIEDTKNGRLIDTDLARQLSPEYQADRTRAPEVHEAASAFTQTLFERRMDELRNKPGGMVLFMAGGGGAGKSSAEMLLASEFDRANTILDGTLSSYDKAERNIQLALDSGQSVIIAYVYREPVEALRNGVFKRAMDPKNGRTVTLDALVKGHAGSNEVVRKLQERFGDNDLFAILAIDNSRGRDNAAVVPLEDIPVVTREGLKEKLQNATDEDHKAGRISDSVYKSTTRGFDTRPESRGQGQAPGDEESRRGEVQERGQLGEPGNPLGNIAFSIRQKPDPEKTVTAYKLFRVEKDRPGELFPLFVPVWGEGGPQKFSNRDPRRHGEGLPLGQWYDAEVGEAAPATKTGKPQVKSKLGGLAFRPGWHAGDLPIATHIGEKSDESLNAPDLRAPNQVWAEVELPDDVDWQTEANKRGVNKKGVLIAREAHITDQIPEDGFYRYKTNSNMTGNWLIGGSMKVNRILSDAEVKAINDAAGTADLPRAEPFDAKAYGLSFSKRQTDGVQLAEDLRRQQEFLQRKAEEAGYKDVEDFVDNDYPAFTKAAAEWRSENPAEALFSRRQTGKETEGWIFSRDETGRFRFGAGAKAYRYAADVANTVLDVVGLKPVSPELARAMRKMKVEIEKAQNLTVDVAKNLKDLPPEERQMISDVIEGELKRGAKPPKHVLELAASMQSIMSEQTAELVRLGMLSPEAAGRWDGKYLPRFYEQKLGDETKAWMKAVKGLLSRKRTMQGIGGNSLKARGMFQTVPVEDLADWEAEGWEKRDDTFDPDTDTEITVWRDFTREERDDMGEIRDAMFRFVMGYNKSQRDIALGRLYESLATNFASRTEQPGYVKVPDTKVEDTMVPRYGKLANKWVPKEVLDQLSAFDSSMQNDLTKMYLKGLSMWKEGKTVLNPVAHANNVLSNLTMAHFAGVSYWDAHKYIGAIKDLVKGEDMVDEAREAGLFGGTFNRAELLKVLPEELKAMAQMTESAVGRNVDRVWNALSLFLRKPLGVAYDAEDQFFRYLIYRDARSRGLEVDDAVDYAQKYIFTYDDLPKTARIIRDMPIGLPFFSYAYKVVPALANTALEHPFRYAAPAAALYTVNALMYAMAASLGGGEDEDWWTIIRRYMTDPEFRQRAKDMEQQERKALPEWMKGASLSLGTQKTIRLGMDDLTNLPVFLDVSRIFPGGDLFDAHNNAGGIPLLAPITPNNPVLTTAAAMLFNKDTFRNKDIVKESDTAAEAAQKRLAWTWKQVTPAISIGNTHFERAMNVIANMTGQPVNVGLTEYTGIGADGLPIQPKYAAMQTVGIKARPIDLETSEKIQASQTKAMIRELDLEIKRLNRLENKGAITGETAEREREKLREKRVNLRQGLTVTGEEKD